MEPQAAVFAKIAAIYGEIGTLQKDGKNQRFNYQYLSEAAIKAALLPLLAKHKLVFRFVQFTDVVRAEVPTREGKTIKTSARAHFEFVDADSGQSAPVCMDMEALDGQDKAFQKLLTNAQKYALFGTFMLPTGDPADDSEHDSNETKTEERKTAQASERVNPEIAKLWEGMTDQRSCVAEIIKWQPVVGETVYRAVLSKYGLEYATDIKSKKTAMAIVADLYNARQAADEMRAA